MLIRNIPFRVVLRGIYPKTIVMAEDDAGIIATYAQIDRLVNEYPGLNKSTTHIFLSAGGYRSLG